MYIPPITTEYIQTNNRSFNIIIKSHKSDNNCPFNIIFKTHKSIINWL